ncbi:pentapeptide repeat-containing protein [Halorientalis brevis]|uniref:Pentapeptide repeat-containing protein n=1 Tax=Halorientalis brevis TaxID=1126241 RepID=A0ABD6CFE8_9EURY|nr:pentapeptide repeat-containing protein [Halorientalis brevis]
MPGTDDRCGFVPDGSEVADKGVTCCWRPVWADREHCIWHASIGEKSWELLEPHASSLGDRLDGAKLRGASLSRTDLFAGCTLIGADFTGATCIETDFSGADLRWTEFNDCNLTGANYAHATLEDTTFVRADLRDADFRRARLYRTVFADAHVNSQTAFDKELVYETRMRNATDAGTKTELGEAAAWTYRRLDRLLRQNAVAKRRHRFYTRAHDVRRRLAWVNDNYLKALKLEGSRWVMRYGVSPWRVLAVSGLLVLVSAFLYPLTGGIQETAGQTTLTYTIEEPTSPVLWHVSRTYVKSLYFSVVTYATLGYGDIQPVGLWARFLAGLETILGSLLIAILVFVLTRSVE